ncbi:E3 ubiquitin-protein ligase parkin-like [Tubulanus polymorphus]|uniref:E3 ubiquitin-protein ligase parkin-like n=1 Tax=Tubulanus polymorphus TaxID=672921 RepID=UPI003DA3DC28
MADEKIKINVKHGKADPIVVNVNSSSSLLELKTALFDNLQQATPDGCKVKWSANDQLQDIKLIFAGRELIDDSAPLKDFDICENTVIHVVLSDKRNRSRKVSDEHHHRLNAVGEENEYFYIYCKSPCGTVKSGKLRVRCCSCKEGAFTLNKDPSCWQDVLVKKQISGKCEDTNCNGQFAEFYFKCHGHTSLGENDTVVALHLIRPNSMGVSCITCLDIPDLVLVFRCNAGHSICLECFRLYCLSKLNERGFIQHETIGYTLRCPAGCDDSFIEEIHHFRILGNEQYDRYQSFGAEELTLKHGGIVCPKPRCCAAFHPGHDQRRVECMKSHLQGCGFVFCRFCFNEYHDGHCDELLTNTPSASGLSKIFTAEQAEKASWEKASKALIRLTTKPCPTCKVKTEHGGGCMHMMCAQCKSEWCWLCNIPWNRDCQGKHWFG